MALLGIPLGSSLRNQSFFCSLVEMSLTSSMYQRLIRLLQSAPVTVK